MVRRDAVMLVAHGTVTDLDDLPAFVQNIRRGRPAPPGLVEELRRRYEAIGGSPLLEVTGRQGRALGEALGLPVLTAMRLWHPGVDDVLADAVRQGYERLCVLPLAPFSVHVYCDAAERSLASIRDSLPRPLELVRVEPWGTEPAFVEAHAARIASTLAGAGDAALVLTAHSLPSRAIQMGDPYADQVSACAKAVGDKLGRDYHLAYQSQGADGGDWLGPDLATTLQQVHSEGARTVVVAPIGFPAEHVETLYDLDIEAAAQARELGLEWHRVPALDDDPGLVRALTGVASRALGRA